MDGSSLQAVCLRWEWKRPILEDVLCIDLPREAEGEESWDGGRQAWAGWRASLGRTIRISAALPGPEGFPCRLHFPFRRLSQVRKVIKSEMEGRIPLPIEETVVDFLPLSPGSGGGMGAFAVAVPKAAISRYLAQLNRLEIVPDRLDFSPLALLRMAVGSAMETGEVPSGFLYIGRGYASVAVVKSGQPLFLRSFRMRGSGEERPIDPAEEIACLVREVLLSLRGWEEAPGSDLSVSRLAICGDGDLASIAPALEMQLGIPCGALSLAEPPMVSAARALPPEVSRRIGAALGTASAALPWRGARFNLRREEYALKEGWQELKMPVAAAAAAALFAFGALAADVAVKVRLEDRRLREAEAQVRSMLTEVFPGSRRVMDPRRQLEAQMLAQARRLAVLDGGSPAAGGPVDVVARISRAIPSSLPLKLNRLEVDEAGVSFEGETTTFEAVDQIKSRLSREPGFAKLEVRQARQIQGKQAVQFSARISFAGGGGR